MRTRGINFCALCLIKSKGGNSNETQKQIFSARSAIAIFLVVALLLGFGCTLYDIQIVNAEYYKAQNNAVKTYTVPIEAARGEIVDRNGNSLVSNRQGNSIVLDAAYFPAKKTMMQEMQ